MGKVEKLVLGILMGLAARQGAVLAEELLPEAVLPLAMATRAVNAARRDPDPAVLQGDGPQSPQEKKVPPMRRWAAVMFHAEFSRLCRFDPEGWASSRC